MMAEEEVINSGEIIYREVDNCTISMFEQEFDAKLGRKEIILSIHNKMYISRSMGNSWPNEWFRRNQQQQSEA